MANFVNVKKEAVNYLVEIGTAWSQSCDPDLVEEGLGVLGLAGRLRSGKASMEETLEALYYLEGYQTK